MHWNVSIMLHWWVSKEFSPPPSNINIRNLCRILIQCKSFYITWMATAQMFTALPLQLPLEVTAEARSHRMVPILPKQQPQRRTIALPRGHQHLWAGLLGHWATLVAAVACHLQEKLGCFRKCIYEQVLFSSQESRGFPTIMLQSSTA